MKIFVKTLNERTITIEVQAEDTVFTVKKKIQEKTGLDPEQQRLVLASRALEDDKKTLADLAVTRESTLFLIERVKPMQIFVLTAEGKTITIEVTRDDTVLEVKKKVERKQGTSVEQQQLVFAGKYLNDTKTLAAYDIQKDATLHLVLRLPGGMAD